MSGLRRRDGVVFRYEFQFVSWAEENVSRRIDV